jgi:ankyrin repeat protein
VLSAGVTLVAGEAGKVPMPVGAANAGMAQPVSIAGVVVGSGETTASAATTTTQASSTMVTGALASTQVALSGGAAKPKPASLLQAAEEGDAAALRAMLEEMHAAGKDVKREVNRYGESRSLQWRSNLYIGQVRRSDEADKSPDSHGWEGLFSTPLIVAAAQGHEECVDVLLKAGAEVDMRDVFGTCLSWAVRGGYAGIVSRLAAAGAAINSTSSADLDMDGRTPLALAVLRGHVAVVHALLKAGARVDLQSPGSSNNLSDQVLGWTPLMYAARAGDADIAQILIEAKANVNAKMQGQDSKSGYKEGMSVLMIAAKSGRANIVRLLIKTGANVNEMLKDEITCPLWLAAYFGHDAETVKTLLDAGARQDYGDNKRGYLPLLTCVAGKAPVGAIQALIQAGARADSVTEYRHTPLGEAVGYHQRVNNVALLMKHGADLEHADQFGQTPLIAAVASGTGPVVQALLDAGANVDSANYIDRLGDTGYEKIGYTFTPLMYAAYSGFTFIARMLLQAGADVNAVNASGGTALALAVQNNHINVVRLLLESGADCKLKYTSGETAYSIASKKGLHEIAMLLQQHS